MRHTPDSPRHRAPERSRDRRHDRARAIFGIADMMAGATARVPPNISSQATTTQTLSITAPCIMEAKCWGGGGCGFDPFNPGPRGGGGGFATAVFHLLPGDIVTYAAGGPGLPGVGIAPPIPGTSGSGLRNGGNGSNPGGGATELYINGTAVLLAGGGGGAALTNGGGGGGANGQNGSSSGGEAGGGGTQSAPGGGGTSPAPAPVSGSPGVGGMGGDGNTVGSPHGGGGGGGFYGGGGGTSRYSYPGFTFLQGPGGGGSGYDSTGTGTLIAATDWQAANRSDPDWTANAGNAEVGGLVVLKFSPV